jgi:hypothetical protein
LCARPQAGHCRADSPAHEFFGLLDGHSETRFQCTMVPPWKKELDALVTETLAFAASVNDRKLAQAKPVDPLVTDKTGSEGDPKDEIVQADPPVLATLDAVLAEESTAPRPLPVTPSPIPEPTTWPARLLPMTVPPSERDEIKQRLANFKADQLRMQTEREDYCARIMAQTRALIDGSPAAKAK